MKFKNIPTELGDYVEPEVTWTYRLVILTVILGFLILFVEYTGLADHIVNSFACVEDDVNGDGQVNITDLSVLAARINAQ